MSCIDLHTHSNRSDGSLSPEELVAYASKKGLRALALTDHDTVSGVGEALKQGEISGIEVIPGIEFSVKSERETHILGYFIDHRSDVILSRLEKLRRSREIKTEKICENLRALGFDIRTEEILENIRDGESVGRVHIANEMIRKGYVSSVSEAFEKYIGKGKPAYYVDKKPEDTEIISIIKKAGGAAYLAHPYSVGKRKKELFAYISYLKDNGLSGIECYYSEYSAKDTDELLAIAAALDLGISGGSDFHGSNKPDIEIGSGKNNLSINYSVLEEMKKRLRY